MSTPQIKTDCFAFKPRSCSLLTEMLCKTRGKCPFYTTKEQYKLDREKYMQKLKD